MYRPKVPQPKRRVNPGGLLVTRAFGDFHAKLIPRGGKPGTVIHDHGAIVKLSVQDLRANGGGYLMLASDGVWDGLEVSDIQDMVQGGAGPSSGSASTTASQSPKNRAQVAPSGNNNNSSSAGTTSSETGTAANGNQNGAGNGTGNKPATMRSIRNTIGKLNGVLDEAMITAADNCVHAAVNSDYWRRAGIVIS
jgi:hypothetical protein